MGLSDAVTNLENGMDTLLGKIGKDGVDISGDVYKRQGLSGDAWLAAMLETEV